MPPSPWATAHPCSEAEKTARRILHAAHERGITLEPTPEGNLRVRPAGEIGPRMREALARAEVKAEVIRLIERGPRVSDLIPADEPGIPYRAWWLDHLADPEPVEAEAAPAEIPEAAPAEIPEAAAQSDLFRSSE